MDTKTGIEHEITNLKGKLTSTYNKIKTTTEIGRNIISDSSQLEIFEVRFSDLRSLYDRFESLFDDLRLLHIKSGQDQAFPDSSLKSLAANVERYYYECCALFNTYNVQTRASVSHSQITSHENSTQDSSRARARLPKLTLPHFSGQLSDWTQFIDIFNSIVHNDPVLTQIEKFHYLLGATSGPPHILLKAIPLAEANYTLAYKALLERYDNKRILASTYLDNILNFTPIKNKPTLTCLQSLLSIISENVAALQTMAMPDLADFILFSLVVRLLDPPSRREFENAHIKETFPSLNSLKSFLKTKCQVIEISSGDIYSTAASSTYQPRNSHIKPSLFSATTNHIDNSRISTGYPPRFSCPSCKQSHRLVECPKFLSLTPHQRYNEIKEYHICFNCFGSHSSKNCKSSYTCRRCKGRHHTMLHFNTANSHPVPREKERIKPVEFQLKNSTEASPAGISATVLSTTCSDSGVLLGTAVAFIYDALGKPHPVRMVLDSGSHFSFITSSLAKRLGLPQIDFKQLIAGVGQANLQGVKKKLTCTLTPKDSPEPRLTTEAIIVPSITSSLPVSELPFSVRKQFLSLHLADPQFWEPAPIDFLLGSDLFMSILTGNKLSFAEQEPNGLSTSFGWVIMGRFSGSLKSQNSCSFFLSASPPTIDETMKRFWEIEEPSVVEIKNPDDSKCENHFVQTFSRDVSGRYIVRLPFKKPISALGNNRQAVMSRFLKLEQRLLRQPELYKEYSSFLKEYFELGHMSIADKPTPYVIPHHAVVKQDSLTTKLRVVFDASFSSPHCSLNSILLPGPKLQLDICDILNNFRIHPIVFMADICKMFRQILLHPDDRNYLHIFWRFSPESPVLEFQLNTVTYGLTCSPFQANRALVQLVEDEGQSFPLASKVLRTSTFVDDIVDGADNIDDALRLQSELIELLRRGGFELRKWSSNCPALLAAVPPEYQIPISMSSKEDAVIKVLGLQWDPTHDCFSFEIRPPVSKVHTKRAVLSHIAKIYDPLGFLAPVVFYAKNILQELWLVKLDWDDELPPSTKEKWSVFIKTLPMLSGVAIPRHILPVEKRDCQILGYCDASQKGYAASIYLRVVTELGSAKTHLLKSKTRLAPLKTISIPRLELCGALLLSRLLLSLKDFCEKINIQRIFLFTDSTIVLCWLATSPHLLKTFVANRVTTILNNTSQFHSSWHHIATDQNPADCASRGLTPIELPKFSLWWNGPHWTALPITLWPIDLDNRVLNEIPELKGGEVSCLVATLKSADDLVEGMSRVSSFSKLLHLWVYVLRFIYLLKFPINKSTCYGPLTYKEISAATKVCVKLVQKVYFRDEYSKIKTFSCSKTLARLTPFIDEDGIIRVGGRLRKTNFSQSFKHPIILPSKCHFSNLVVDYFHKICLHAGPRTLHSLIQREYWILGARNLIRHRTFKCTVCYRLKAISKVPIMGELPPSRFVQGRPFINVAVDFAGPFLIKESTRRNAKISKAYLCIFICMATKAVHLEVVSSLCTEAFLACFDRFIARRGLCSIIYSDCGRNFIGAARKLKEIEEILIKRDSQMNIMNYFSNRGITWIFQPPYAPNFNGLVEAGVKSAKHHLTRIAGDRSFSFEELSTIFSRIEAVLNSRPLSPLSSNPEEFDALTPGHFIVGGPLLSRPELDVTDVSENRLVRWQLLQQFSQHFWKRWSSEYVHTLQQRKKWTKSIPNLSIGNLVLLKSNTSSPLIWPLARITATHPGDDGVVRVVSVKTSTGLFRRPVSKLVLLE